MELNISISQLKRTCHQLGLERWPHRKLASLHQLRSFLEQQPLRDAHIQQAHLMRIELEMQRILNNPNHVIDPELLALRRYSWKRAQRIKNSASSSGPATPQHVHSPSPSLASPCPSGSLQQASTWLGTSCRSTDSTMESIHSVCGTRSWAGNNSLERVSGGPGCSPPAAAFRHQQDQPDTQQEWLQQGQWLKEQQWQSCLPPRALPLKHIKSVCTSELELMLDSLASSSVTQPHEMQGRALHYNAEAVHPVLKRNLPNPEQSARRYRTECGALESVSGHAYPAAVKQDEEDVRLNVRRQLGPQFCGESRSMDVAQAATATAPPLPTPALTCPKMFSKYWGVDCRIGSAPFSSILAQGSSPAVQGSSPAPLLPLEYEPLPTRSATSFWQSRPHGVWPGTCMGIEDMEFMLAGSMWQQQPADMRTTPGSLPGAEEWTLAPAPAPPQPALQPASPKPSTPSCPPFVYTVGHFTHTLDAWLRPVSLPGAIPSQLLDDPRPDAEGSERLLGQDALPELLNDPLLGPGAGVMDAYCDDVLGMFHEQASSLGTAEVLSSQDAWWPVDLELDEALQALLHGEAGSAQGLI